MEQETEAIISSIPEEASYQPLEEEEQSTPVELHIQEEMQLEPILEATDASEETPVVIYERRARSSYIPRAFLLVAAGLAVLVAVIGTGSLDFIAKQGSMQASTINFLSGVGQYEKISK